MHKAIGAGIAALALAILGAASVASAASIVNLQPVEGPTQSDTVNEFTVQRFRYSSAGYQGLAGNRVRVLSGTAANMGATISGPETLNAELSADWIVRFDVIDATGPYTVAVEVSMHGFLRTEQDAFTEGDNGQALATVSDVLVTVDGSTAASLQTAASRGPTINNGTLAVGDARTYFVSGTPQQNHHEIRLRWSSGCQSIVAGRIGNGLRCWSAFGAEGDPLRGGSSDVDGDGLFVDVNLVGTPTPSRTFTPPPTGTPTSTPTPTQESLTTLRISDASVVEGAAGSRTMVFVVDVVGPRSGTIGATFATANGTARAGEDFVARSGRLSLPLNQDSTTVEIQVIGDTRLEGDEVFSVRLSNAVNAGIADNEGIGRIIDDELVGTPELLGGDQTVASDEVALLTLRWTHPDRWRALDTVDLRLVDDQGPAFWGRFTEGSDAFSICEGDACGPDLAPGAPPVHSGPATFHPSLSRVQGSGPTGPHVDLTFAVSLDPSTAGRRFQVEVAASDDDGTEQPFAAVGSLSVPAQSGADDDSCAIVPPTRPSAMIWSLMALALAGWLRGRRRGAPFRA